MDQSLSSYYCSTLSSFKLDGRLHENIAAVRWRSNANVIVEKSKSRRVSFRRFRESPPKICNSLGQKPESSLKVDKKTRILGSAVVEKNTDLIDTIFDAINELLGRKIEAQLVSIKIDPAGEGKRSKVSNLVELRSRADETTYYSVDFSDMDKDFGTPGAILIENNHRSEFFLRSITLKMPDESEIHFVCESWVYNTSKYSGPRIFFSNKVYLPGETPEGLRTLREGELVNLRGVGYGEREESDRIYDYDVYNDLGDPDKGKEYARPVLGASHDYPYPRRCRTGRERTKSDPASETPVSPLSNVYVPADERFSHVKQSDFLTASVQSFGHLVVPAIEDIFSQSDGFESLAALRDLYKNGLDVSEHPAASAKMLGYKAAVKLFPLSAADLKKANNARDSNVLKFPLPKIIEKNWDAWMTDEEFARQALAGLNPLMIRRLEVFPPVSKLDSNVYGPSTSAITAEHIEGNLEGLTALEALKRKKLFVVDYHDIYMPYLEKINSTDGKAYASRTLLYLNKEGILKPVAIELSLPPKEKGGQVISRVFTPPTPLQAEEDNWLWLLARTHATSNDSGYHELISHWLRTHACMEPFIIASHRHLSALHPLHLLLKPHFKCTMNINSLARKALINCDTGSSVVSGGIIEKAFTPGKYSIEMSSVLYKNWRFDQQGLPADLIERGIAEKDATATNGLRLLIEDYPFAVDGLDVWFALESWVKEYVSFYYKSDQAVQEDYELQVWWREIREVGHGDKKNEKWWASMQTVDELQEVVVTIIWVASALHAAVNFGQYAYAGFMPNKATMCRRLIPEKNTEEYAEFVQHPERFFLRTVADEAQATIVMATTEILSSHASNEEYLGMRTPANWTSDERVVGAFKRFGEKVGEIEERIKGRNEDPKLKQRHGPVKVAYTLLLPRSEEAGVTGKGVPNSISISSHLTQPFSL